MSVNALRVIIYNALWSFFKQYSRITSHYDPNKVVISGQLPNYIRDTYNGRDHRIFGLNKENMLEEIPADFEVLPYPVECRWGDTSRTGFDNLHEKCREYRIVLYLVQDKGFGDGYSCRVFFN